MSKTVKPCNLNQSQLIESVAAESGYSPSAVTDILRTTFDVIGRTVTAGFLVRVVNFGTWYSREVAPRTVRNPQTGDKWEAEAHHRPAFRWATAVRKSTREGVSPASFRKKGNR